MYNFYTQRCEAAAIVARMAVPSLRQTFTLKPSSGRVLVAWPLERDPLNQAVTADSVVIQDLVEFCNGGLNYTGTGNVSSKTTVTYTETEATINICGVIKRGGMDVRVRVPCTYGVDGPDVLTGIPRNVERQRTYTCRIEIQ